MEEAPYVMIGEMNRTQVKGEMFYFQNKPNNLQAWALQNQAILYGNESFLSNSVAILDTGTK